MYPPHGNDSMSRSISSISTSTTGSMGGTRKTSSVKSSTEYRALRLQFFQLQSAHSNLKLVHERESIVAASQKAQLHEKLQELQNQLDEIKKDQVFILKCEGEIKNELENVKEERDSMEKSLKNRNSELEMKLAFEQERAFDLENKLKKSHYTNEDNNTDKDVEFVNEIIREWKDRVISLINQNLQLERQLDEMKSKTIFDTYSEMGSSCDSNEELRRKLFSTYVSLESAQSSLGERKLEAERLSVRIGNVKILEERYRDAQIRIKRLENELLSSRSSNIISRPDSPRDVLSSDLKLIQLTQELGNLKESHALASLNYDALQSDFNSIMSEMERLKMELETQNALQPNYKVQLK